MTQNYCCMDCGNLICINTAIYGNGRCKPCSLYIQKGKGNPNYKHGKACKRDKFCIECGKKLKSMRANRCMFCDTKWRIKHKKWPYRNGNYKVKFCVNCEKELKSRNKNVKRCPRCAGEMERGKNNPNFGKDGRQIHRHHVNLNRKDNCKKNILILTASKHTQLHQRAYAYLVEKGKIWHYIKWFDKNFGLK